MSFNILLPCSEEKCVKDVAHHIYLLGRRSLEHPIVKSWISGLTYLAGLWLITIICNASIRTFESHGLSRFLDGHQYTVLVLLSAESPWGFRQIQRLRSHCLESFFLKFSVTFSDFTSQICSTRIKGEFGNNFLVPLVREDYETW